MEFVVKHIFESYNAAMPNPDLRLPYTLFVKFIIAPLDYGRKMIKHDNDTSDRKDYYDMSFNKFVMNKKKTAKTPCF